LTAGLTRLPFGEMLRLEMPLDFRVLLYSGLIAVLTALLFGLLPAWQGSRDDLATLLKGVTVTGGRLRLRLATLTGQIALSLVLLLTAGLFVRAVMRFHNIDPGFASANRLFAPVFVPQPQFTPASSRTFYDQTLQRLRALPGVRSAALTTRLPLYAAGIGSSGIARASEKPAPATTFTVGAGYFDTLRIP